MEPFTLTWLKTRVKILDNGCWMWTGATVNSGYGKLKRGPVYWLVHRYVYTQVKGEIHPNHVVRHTCNEKLCVNPDHLITGTYQDNLFDQIENGIWQPPHGKCKPISHYRNIKCLPLKSRG